MRRLTGYGLGLALALLLGSAPNGHGATGAVRRALIYFDAEGASAQLHVNALRNLLGHFHTEVGWASVSSHTSGALAGHDAVFYLGSRTGAPLPAAFLADVAAATAAVVWLNYNLDQLLASSNDTAGLGLTYLRRSNGFTQVTYKSTPLYKPAANSEVVAVAASNAAAVLATAEAAGATNPPPVPYAVRSSNFWFIADNPFANSTVPDRALVLADLLHDILASGAATNHRAVARIEDVNPGTTSRPLMQDVAAALAARGVPGHFGVIPFYRDPLGLYNGGVPQDTLMTSNRPFLRSLQAAARNGIRFIDHGWTHQRDTQITASGYEFWNETSKAPLAEDGWDWAAGRLESARSELARAGFPLRVWETPHYSASLLDQHVFAARYATVFERIPLFNSFTAGLSVSNLAALSSTSTTFALQITPYAVHHSIYSNAYLPENLQYYSPGGYDSDGLEFTASNKAVYARRLKVVRDAVACFYFHLQFGTNTVPALTNLVAAIEAEGFTFTDIETLLREPPAGAPAETNANNQLLVLAAATNLAAELRVGDSGSGNAVAVTNGAAAAGVRAIVGHQAGAAANQLTVDGAGSRLDLAQHLIIGYSGSSNLLRVAGGAQINAADLFIGDATNASANRAWIDGAAVTAATATVVGQRGRGNDLVVTNGGTLAGLHGLIGADAPARSNRATVAGSGSAWRLAGNLAVGVDGAGNQLAVRDGGLVLSDRGVIGDYDLAADNLAWIDGTNSMWSNRLTLVVGNDAPRNQLVATNGGSMLAAALIVGNTGSNNSLTVAGGGRAVSASGDIGFAAGSTGNLATVTGAGSIWTNSGALGVGAAGAGNGLIVSSSGRVVSSSSSIGVSGGANDCFAAVAGSGSLWQVNGSLNVGNSGAWAALTITTGGVVRTSSGRLGRNSTSSNNAARLAGPGAIWTNSGPLIVGVGTAGNSLGAAGGAMIYSTDGFVGSNGLDNVALLTDAGTAWLSSGSLHVGYDGGPNTLVVSHGALAQAATLIVGNGGSNNLARVAAGGRLAAAAVEIGYTYTAASNRVAVSGPGALLACSGSIVAGNAGEASALEVSDGGTVTSSFSTVGLNAGADGNRVVVTDAGSRWHLNGSLTLGYDGAGNQLTVVSGGVVRATTARVGRDVSSSNNAARVAGAGSVWTNTDVLYVGLAGGGNTLRAEQGGKVFSLTGYLGSNSAHNTAWITDAGSAWSCAGPLYVGFSGGTNTLVVSNGAVVSAQSVYVGFNAGSANNRVVVDGGRLAATNGGGGPLQVRRGTLEVSGGAVAAAGLLIDADGGVTLSGPVNLQGVGPVTNRGLLSVSGDTALPSHLALESGGSLAGPTNMTWTVGGDWLSSSTNAAMDLLHAGVAFTSNALHRLSLGCADHSNRLAGFSANRALGRLTVRGTVDVVGVVYAWSLAGAGQLQLGPGDCLFYADAAGWTGSADTSGGGVFQRVPVAAGPAEPLDDGAVRLSWPSAPGLNFRIEWAPAATNGVFTAATNLVGAGTNDLWIDQGGSNRPAPAAHTQRLYRLIAWP